MSVKILVAIIAVAGLLLLGTAVYAHGPGMGWGYSGHMTNGFGWGHHMGYNGYGPHMGYGYQQGRADNNPYYGYHHGFGYQQGQRSYSQMPHEWTNTNGKW